MINNLIKNICLIIFALIGPITLPAGGIQKSLYGYNLLNNSQEFVLGTDTSLFSFPQANAKKLMVLNSGSSITILRNWKVNEKEMWIRVELASNKILDDPYRITKGWIKM